MKVWGFYREKTSLFSQSSDHWFRYQKSSPPLMESMPTLKSAGHPVTSEGFGSVTLPLGTLGTPRRWATGGLAKLKPKAWEGFALEKWMDGLLVTSKLHLLGSVSFGWKNRMVIFRDVGIVFFFLRGEDDLGWGWWWSFKVAFGICFLEVFGRWFFWDLFPRPFWIFLVARKMDG